MAEVTHSKRDARSFLREEYERLVAQDLDWRGSHSREQQWSLGRGLRKEITDAMLEQLPEPDQPP